MTRSTRKLLSATGIVLAGDAAAALLGPRRHMRVWSWEGGPAWYGRAMDALRRDTRKLWGLTVAELAAGLGLVALARRGL